MSMRVLAMNQDCDLKLITTKHIETKYICMYVHMTYSIATCQSEKMIGNYNCSIGFAVTTT